MNICHYPSSDPLPNLIPEHQAILEEMVTYLSSHYPPIEEKNGVKLITSGCNPGIGFPLLAGRSKLIRHTANWLYQQEPGAPLDELRAQALEAARELVEAGQ